MAKGNQGNLSSFNEIQVGDVILEFSHPLKINAFQSNSYVGENDYRWWLHFCLYVCSPLTGGNVLPWFDSCIYVAGGSDKKPTKTPWIGAVIEAQPLAPVMYGDDFSYPVICWESWNKDNPSMNPSGFHGSCHVWVERCHCSLGKKICSLGMMSTSCSTPYLHIPVSFIFWDVIQVLNFVHLDFLLLGML